MQGREGMDRTFLDAVSVAGHLVDPGSMFAFLTQLIAAVPRVARVVPGAADLVTAVCTGMTTPRSANRGSSGRTPTPRTAWSRRWSTTPSQW